jgi:hypothetical protein
MNCKEASLCFVNPRGVNRPRKMNGFNQHSFIYSSQSGPCAQHLPTITGNHATGASKKLSLKLFSARRLPGPAGSRAGHSSGSRERCRSPSSHFVQCRCQSSACSIGFSSSSRASAPFNFSSWRQLQRPDAALQCNHCSPCLASSSKEVSPTIASAAEPYRTPDARGAAQLAVFVSGGGSNLKALHAAVSDGRINGTIVVRSIDLQITAPVHTPLLLNEQASDLSDCNDFKLLIRIGQITATYRMHGFAVLLLFSNHACYSCRYTSNQNSCCPASNARAIRSFLII